MAPASVALLCLILSALLTLTATQSSSDIASENAASISANSNPVDSVTAAISDILTDQPSEQESAASVYSSDAGVDSSSEPTNGIDSTPIVDISPSDSGSSQLSFDSLTGSSLSPSSGDSLSFSLESSERSGTSSSEFVPFSSALSFSSEGSLSFGSESSPTSFNAESSPISFSTSGYFADTSFSFSGSEYSSDISLSFTGRSFSSSTPFSYSDTISIPSLSSELISSFQSSSLSDSLLGVSFSSDYSLNASFSLPISDSFSFPISDSFSFPISDSFSSLIGDSLSLSVSDSNSFPISTNPFSSLDTYSASIFFDNSFSSPISDSSLSFSFLQVSSFSDSILFKSFSSNSYVLPSRSSSLGVTTGFSDDSSATLPYSSGFSQTDSDSFSFPDQNFSPSNSLDFSSASFSLFSISKTQSAEALIFGSSSSLLPSLGSTSALFFDSESSLATSFSISAGFSDDSSSLLYGSESSRESATAVSFSVGSFDISLESPSESDVDPTLFPSSGIIDTFPSFTVSPLPEFPTASASSFSRPFQLSTSSSGSDLISPTEFSASEFSPVVTITEPAEGSFGPTNVYSSNDLSSISYRQPSDKSFTSLSEDSYTLDIASSEGEEAAASESGEDVVSDSSSESERSSKSETSSSSSVVPQQSKDTIVSPSEEEPQSSAYEPPERSDLPEESVSDTWILTDPGLVDASSADDTEPSAFPSVGPSEPTPGSSVEGVTSSSILSTTPAPVTAAPVPQTAVSFTIIFAGTFDPSLSDSTSDAYIALAASLTSAMNSIYSSLPNFVQVTVIVFFPGSIGANYSAVFNDTNQNMTELATATLARTSAAVYQNGGILPGLGLNVTALEETGGLAPSSNLTCTHLNCDNNGLCTSTIYGAVCDCTSLWTGDTCSALKSENNALFLLFTVDNSTAGGLHGSILEQVVSQVLNTSQGFLFAAYDKSDGRSLYIHAEFENYTTLSLTEILRLITSNVPVSPDGFNETSITSVQGKIDLGSAYISINCSDLVCRNRGQCTTVGLGPVCECTPQWGGEDCETFEPAEGTVGYQLTLVLNGTFFTTYGQPSNGFYIQAYEKLREIYNNQAAFTFVDLSIERIFESSIGIDFHVVASKSDAPTDYYLLQVLSTYVFNDGGLFLDYPVGRIYSRQNGTYVTGTCDTLECNNGYTCRESGYGVSCECSWAWYDDTCSQMTLVAILAIVFSVLGGVVLITFIACVVCLRCVPQLKKGDETAYTRDMSIYSGSASGLGLTIRPRYHKNWKHFSDFEPNMGAFPSSSSEGNTPVRQVAQGPRDETTFKWVQGARSYSVDEFEERGRPAPNRNYLTRIQSAFWRPKSYSLSTPSQAASSDERTEPPINFRVRVV